MRVAQFTVLMAAVYLAGCVSAAQQKADAIKQAKDHCDSEGKRFVLKQADSKTNYTLLTRGIKTMVTGYCLGPDDPVPADVMQSAPTANDAL